MEKDIKKLLIDALKAGDIGKLNGYSLAINMQDTLKTDLKGIVLENIHLCGLNFINVDFSNAKFFNVDFSHSTLNFSVFKNTEFINCKFKNADLNFSDFQNATIKDCDFKEAGLEHCNFKKAYLFATSLNRTKLEGTKLACISIYPYQTYIVHDELILGCEKMSVKKWQKLNEKRLMKLDGTYAVKAYATHQKLYDFLFEIINHISTT
mgnify:CR=1 FL=1